MRLLVKADVPTWAFARRALAYQKYHPEGWEVQSGWDGNERLDEDWDAVFLLSAHSSIAEYGDVRYARMLGSHCWLYDADPTDWRTRGCNESRCRSQLARVLGRSHCVAVYNCEQMSLKSECRSRFALAPYSVDTEIFCPLELEREQNRKLKVGWAYQVSGGLKSFKGLSDVLVPLISHIGDRVEWSVLTPAADSCLSAESIAQWYRSLDVFLCTSSAEGGPQGPFEAAACGAVVVSTDVGQVSDWTALRGLNLVVPTYRNAQEAAESVRQMAERILQLSEDRAVLEMCRQTLLNDIRHNWNAAIECPRQLLEIFPK